MRYVDYVYNMVSTECKDMDSIYADYIIRLVGVYGLHALESYQLVETCGVVNGRQLFTLLEKKERV